MSFEKNLIKLFVEHDRDLSEWIRDEKLDEFHMLTTNMFREGELETDYSKKCRLLVVRGGGTDKPFDVDEFRKYFLSSYSGVPTYAGSRSHIEKLLKEYMAERPGHTFNLICKAAKYYVDQYKGSRYLMKAANFIINDKGESTLEACVDDVIAGSTSSDEMTDLI